MGTPVSTTMASRQPPRRPSELNYGLSGVSSDSTEVVRPKWVPLGRAPCECPTKKTDQCMASKRTVYLQQHGFLCSTRCCKFVLDNCCPFPTLAAYISVLS